MDATQLITIVAESLLEERIVQALEKLGAPGYTVSDARGSGSRGRKRGTFEFNKNVRIEVLCSAAQAELIAAHMQEHYQQNYAMALWITDVREPRGSKA